MKRKLIKLALSFAAVAIFATQFAEMNASACWFGGGKTETPDIMK